ncbi:MAG TPA: GTP 3',8-cyclase MoaA [Gemmatimonadales bacterium]|nr:GTP 3',8-cyclase MoaA [Gemmatimonadales bacterium]
MTLRDQWNRPLGTLRISVTDRCNLRCNYCMPEAEYTWLPRESLLSFEEIARLAGVIASLGASAIRITGGEPLLRRDLAHLVSLLRALPAVRDIALTTNGTLLAAHAAALHAAGLDRITVSLDTLRPERMQAMSRSAHHRDVLDGLDAASHAGFNGIKLNTVVMRGVNSDELVAIARFATERGIEPRFIEYMDVGGATRWREADVFTQGEMLAALGEVFGPWIALPTADDPAAPARRFRFADGTVVGVIASTTAPFCGDCDRMRLTADGTLLLCLYADSGQDLREAVRGGASDAELALLIRTAWESRRDRGAEARLGVPARGALVELAGLRQDPRREMHVRGG